MNTIPVITTDVGLFARVAGLIKAVQADPPDVIRFQDPALAIEFLDIEMPDLFFVNFSDPGIDTLALLHAITADPWLIHGGIIALCDRFQEAKRFEKMRDADIVCVLPRKGMDYALPRVMDIINHNRRILFQRDMGTDIIRDLSGHFRLRNDPLEASCYANLICNFLYNANRLDLEAKSSLYLALEELFMNAIEHGNCGITYEDKHAWLLNGGAITDLIEQRCRDAETAAKRVSFEYAITPTCSRFVIADEGGGFNWHELADPTARENILKPHGRGIVMARASTENLTYNEKGNEVRFEINHQQDVASLTPGLVQHIEPREVKEGDIICRQGEPGTCLYYIASGRYDVIVDGQTVASLSPEDVFMGEMAFLLNDRRSATLRAATRGRIIEVSKRDFVNTIKKKPHYALLLSRLLAQRLQRLTRQSAQHMILA